MKHKGAISQIYKTRDEVVVPELYSRAKSEASYPTTTRRLFEIAANLPVDRYYISDYAALEYVRNRVYRRQSKQITHHINPYKHRLFEDLYDTVMKMMREEKYAAMGLTDTVICALLRPAPCVGLTPATIWHMYRKGRKRTRERESNEKV